MRVLYISTVFPRPDQSSTIYTDLAEELKSRGHEIVVVAADGKEDFEKTIFREERGLSVLRVKTRNMYDVGLIRKGIAVLTLKYYMINAIKTHLKNQQFDMILFESPPITIADIVRWAMKRFRCPSYLMLKDIFPQNAVDLGIIKMNSIVHRFFKWREKRLYQTASMIGCMSLGNKNYLLEHHDWITPNRVEIFPNTKRIQDPPVKTREYNLRKKYGIPVDAVVAVFGGNMGKPQGLDFLIDAIAKYRDRKDVFFLLVGRGTERERIRARIENEKLTNILVLDGLPRDEYEQLVNECDIGLILLDKRFTIPNYPSRVLSYFEYCMPVLAATDRCTDFGKMIEESESGYWVEAGDIEDFVNKLDLLVNSEELRNKMGRAGRVYLEKHFQVGISAKILEKYYSRISI